MKRIVKSLYILSVFLLASCVDDLTSLNDNPKAAKEVPASALFTNAQRNMTDAITYGVNFKVLAQYWSETTYTDVSRYFLPDVGNTFWNTMYRDVLKDFNEAQRLINEDETFITPEQLKVKANQLAVTEIMNVYAFSLLVNTFGDVPYTKAFDINNVQPAYDDAATIYQDLIVRLNNSLTTLDPAYDSFGDADIVYNGDVAQWVKFGNSLKLRMGMTLADADPATAKTLAEQAAPNVFTSNADNALFQYLESTPNTNPIWVNLVQSGREDYVASNTILDLMNDLGDPRVSQYFTQDEDGGYSGGTYGTSNNYSAFSKAGLDAQKGTKATTIDLPGVLLDYSEVEFYLAEAVERGFNVGGTAAEHYNAGITASFQYWYGVNDESVDAANAAATAYLAKPTVAYATAAGDFKQKIGTQKWIALYNRGFEGWMEWRRLDAPAFNMPPDPLGDQPVRYTYPVAEQNLNGSNYASASSAIGGDKVTTKLFWDKF